MQKVRDPFPLKSLHPKTPSFDLGSIRWLACVSRPAGNLFSGKPRVLRQKTPKLIDEIKEVAHGTNVDVLENQSFEIGNVVFLGATLWTDFRLNRDPVLAEVATETGMTDFRRIRVTPSYRRFRPSDARRFHTQS